MAGEQTLFSQKRSGINGTIDEVAILDTALDAARAQQLYQFGPVGVVK